MVAHTGTRQLKIIWNIIQENPEDKCEFSSVDCALNTLRYWTVQFYGEKFQAFYLVTVELEFNTLQSFSGIEQQGVKNKLFLNIFIDNHIK